jgi:hypothetical protein
MSERDDLLAALAATNPVDDAVVSAAWASSPLRQQMLEEIEMSDERSVTTLARPARGGRWNVPRVGTVAAGVALAAVLVTNALISPETAFAVRPLEDGRIEVTIDDLADGTVLSDELREFGVDVTVVPEIASPSQVGRVAGIAGAGVDDDGQLPPGLEISADGDPLRILIDPARFDRGLTLYVGVPAGDGETYTLTGHAFAEGEPLAGLHCTLGLDLTADQVSQAARAAGVTIEWTVITDVTLDTTGYVSSSRPAPSAPAGRVVSAYPRDADTVAVEVVPDDLPNGDVIELNEPDSLDSCPS